MSVVKESLLIAIDYLVDAYRDEILQGIEHDKLPADYMNRVFMETAVGIQARKMKDNFRSLVDEIKEASDEGSTETQNTEVRDDTE